MPLAMTAQAGSVRRWAPRRNHVLCAWCAKSATKCDDEDAATATVDLGKTSGSKAIGLAMGLTGTALNKYELRPISGCVHFKIPIILGTAGGLPQNFGHSSRGA